MKLDDILSLIRQELSGTLTKDLTSKLTFFHRIQGSPGFLEAAEFLKDQLKKQTCLEIELKNYPADGKSKSWAWEPPISWKINNGILKLDDKEDPHILAWYDEVPVGITTHSKPTRFEGLEIEHVGEGVKAEDYEGKNIQDKLVMAWGRVKNVSKLAMDLGAKGILSYPSPERSKHYPGIRLYQGLWPTEETREISSFGFSVSAVDANMLLTKLSKGETVTVSGEINAELYDGELHVLTAFLPPEVPSDKELVLIAHLCHPTPSANDNASGSALLVEIARVFSELKEKNLFPKQKIGLRFLWVPEFSGTVAWLKENSPSKMVACINCDMVGQSPEKVGEPFTLYRAGFSTPSFLNDLLETFLESVANGKIVSPGGWRHPMNYRIRAFATGSDHLLFSYLGVPGVMLGHDDPFWHSSMDTIDKVDPTELQRVGNLTASTALAIISLDTELSEELLTLVGQGSLNRLVEESNRVRMKMINEEEDLHEAFFLGKELLQRSVEREQLSSKSVIQLANIAGSHTDILDSLDNIIYEEVSTLSSSLIKSNNNLYYQFCQRKGISPLESIDDHENLKSLKDQTYQRTTEGPVPYDDFEKIVDEDDKKFFKEDLPSHPLDGVVIEFISLVDGNRSSLEILAILKAEYDTITVEKYNRTMKILEEIGLVKEIIRG